MKLSLEGIRSAGSGYVLPAFDIQAMREKTRVSPEWLHFGAGNLFRVIFIIIYQLQHFLFIQKDGRSEDVCLVFRTSRHVVKNKFL